MINAANCITCFRLLGGVALAFLKPLTMPFYTIYTLCGASDALDGPIARHTHTAGEFGAKLDSTADLVFYFVLLLRLLPEMRKVLPIWIWTWVSGIVALRVISYTVAAVKFHCFSSHHTWMNKGTSLVLFGIPYLLRHPFFTQYGVIVCTVATMATVEELLMHLVSSSYSPKSKSLIDVWNNKAA